MNSEGSQQLSYKVLRQNVLNDIQQPLETGSRQTDVRKTFHIFRDAKRYALESKTQTKKYQLVFNKRVVDPQTFKTYPYGSVCYLPDDEDMTELLLDLLIVFGRSSAGHYYYSKRPAM